MVSATVSQAPTPPSNGRKSKKEKTPPAPTQPLIEVILHDTVIFPEGGGQPSDVGVLTSADGELWDVIEVKRHGGHAVHYVRAKDQSPDSALRAFSPGAKVGVALGEQGWRRRLDHVRPHISTLLRAAGTHNFIDVHAHLTTLAIRRPGHAKPADALMVPDGMAHTLVRRDPTQHECGRDRVRAGRSEPARLRGPQRARRSRGAAQ